MNRILNLLQNSWDILKNGYMIIRAQYPGVVICGLIFPIMFSFLAAWTGQNWINIILLFFTAIAAPYVFSHPGIVGSIVIIGTISSPHHPINNSTDISKMIVKTAGYYIFFLSLWFFIIGTMGIGRNPGNVFFILAALLIIFMMTLVWAITSKWPQRILLIYAVAVLLISIAGIIPATTYNKVLGVDPLAYFRTSEVDEQIVAVEETANKVIDRYHGWLLTHVENKISGKPDDTDVNKVLSIEAEARKDMQTAEAVKEKRNRNSIIGLYKQARNSFRNPKGVEGAEDNPEIRIIKHSMNVWEVEFLTDKMTQVLRRWPAETKIMFNGFKEGEVMRNDPAGGDVPFYLPVGRTLVKKSDTVLIAQAKIGTKMLLNFSKG
ncbi:MAG: hypothetical protein WC349_05040 [Patescibacteria group bacterium]|jgi:hypothetical protein